jgi:hypothetical protein
MGFRETERLATFRRKISIFEGWRVAHRQSKTRREYRRVCGVETGRGF